MRRLTALVLAAALASTACGRSRPRENVQPPSPGVPASGAEVQGIYRTIHQALIQLRGNGAFVMVIPEGPGPSAGTYSLADGLFRVLTDDCGDIEGEYRLRVGGRALPGEATLHFDAVRDDCGERLYYLTIDPWVYANS